MSIILFLIILAILIFVHELGHFLIAKLFKIRVDEFALGFPPTLMKKRVGETEYKLNIIPFGGYVSIFGENPDEESLNGPEAKARSMAHKPRPVQAAVLAAGVIFNMIFAWILISLTLMIGISPIASFNADSDAAKEGKVIITNVVEGSPAAQAGIIPGDVVFQVSDGKQTIAGDALDVPVIQEFIASHPNTDITFGLYRNGEEQMVSAKPQAGVVSGSDKAAIGIAMESDALVQVPWYRAPIEGFKTTLNVTVLTAVGLWNFVGDAFGGTADFNQVAGPVGIVGMVGSASESGLAYVLFFTALISINLAIINILPFPALDGGRLLFVLIESIMRRPIAPKIANALNAVGFALLLLLMVVVTFSDVIKIFK